MKKVLLSLAFAAFGLTINSYGQTIISQNFTGASVPGMPSGWTAAHTGAGLGWQTTTSATDLYFGTVPNTAPHTEYAVVDDYSNPGNDPATMTSPSFSLVGVTAPELSYDYLFFQAYLPGSGSAADTPEQAWVQISTDGGTTWTLLDSITYVSTVAWATNYVNLSAYIGSANCKIQFVYTDNGGAIIGCAVGNVSVFNAEANDIALTAVTPVAGASNDYFATGTNVTFAGTALNNGPTAISSFTAYYQVGSAAAVPCPVSASIAAFGTYNFTCSTPYTVASIGNQPVTMWLEATGDPILSNDSMTTAINGVSFMPTKKLMFEECNGTWCGYCVRGIVYMDSLWTLDSNSVSIVSVHDYNGYDPMAQENSLTEAYDSYSQTFITGYPSIIIDRSVVDDPSNALYDYSAMSGNFGFANIGITSATYDASGSGAINVTCSVSPALNLTGDYRVELVLTENNVHDATNAGYAQHNYYSYQDLNEALSGSGYNFQDSLEVIPASSMYYHFVDRYTVPSTASSPNGVAGSLPSSMTAGSNYSYTFTTVTPTGTQAWDLANMSAVVMLIDNNSGDATYQQVLNSNNMMLQNVLSVTSPSGVEVLRLFPNPTTDVAHLTFNLANAGNVQFSILDVTGKTVFNAPAEFMSAGGQQINFSTAEFAAGVYNVMITTETGTTTLKLSVLK